MDDLSFTADFASPTREQWLDLVGRILKGRDFGTLVSATYDGLEITPLYPKSEAPPQPWRSAGPWRVSQRVDHPDPAAANALARTDLEGGANALTIVLPKVPAARGFGVDVRSVDDLDAVLQGISLDQLALRLDAGAAARGMAALLVGLAARRGHRGQDLDIDFATDPVGAMATRGYLCASWPVVAARCTDVLHYVHDHGINARVLMADGRPYHEAGASEVQELAAVLATGVAYLRALEAGGHTLEAARGALSFLLVADADQFLTVAKFRAFRRLWARIEQACGLAPKLIRLHAETAWRMTTRRDPWVNLLRATVATFSAGIGGADTITALPFTTALGLPDAFARRLARNTQLILMEEANLWRVADPSAGAGAFEDVTAALAEQAWSLFQEIEREGGIVISLMSGNLQDQIATVRTKREAAVAKRQEPITGVSEFPLIGESDVAVLLTRQPNEPDQAASPAASPKLKAKRPRRMRGAALLPTGKGDTIAFSSLVRAAQGGAGLGELMIALPGPGAFGVEPLPSVRSAEPFERLRDRSDTILAQSGARPMVFLITLGSVADFIERATFAKNFFEAGGIEAVTAEGAHTLEAAVTAFRRSGIRIACVCSSDEVCESTPDEAASPEETLAEQTIRRLQRTACERVYLAGRPGNRHVPYEAAGLTGYIHAGCDALAILADAQAASSADLECPSHTAA